MTPDGLLLLAAYGAACYVLGLVCGAVVIPGSWTVAGSRSVPTATVEMSDERRPSSDYRWARQVAALLLILVDVVRRPSNSG